DCGILAVAACRRCATWRCSRPSARAPWRDRQRTEASEKIRDHLAGDKRVSYINNDEYATTNILTSFWLALKEYNGDEDLVVMAGDVVFDPEILKKMASYENVDILVATDSRKIDPEAVKVTIEGEKVARFGKDMAIENAHGQFLGLMKVSAETINEMRELVRRMVLSDGCGNGYLFDMLNIMINEYAKKIGHFDIGGHFWEEIDFKEDWERANNVLRGRGICRT
ncbi:MAG: hypothetical protein KKB12_03685, partial [Candidatus Omnitrophica bacterium]|nr:hypothetical protein [Candidatus Omnitrophota bacterium]